MSDKLPIGELLAGIDTNSKNLWNELTEAQRKNVSFWLLNRWASSVNGSREKQELAVVKTNEYYNKHFNDIGVGKEKGHPQLMWQLLCTTSVSEDILYHQWIGLKKKSADSKAVKLLEQIYPAMKTDEVELLARLSTRKELKQLAEEHGIEGFKL